MSWPNDGPAGTPVVLALGSNLGDRRAHLALGLRVLSEHICIEAVSRLVESDPWGPIPEQGPFLNLVVRGRTALDPTRLLAMAREAEKAAGRVRRRRFGPRTLDVDVIFFGEVILDAPELTLPHPRWQERPFVYALLPDVAGDFLDPRSGERVSDLVPPGPLPRGLQELEPLEQTSRAGSLATGAPCGDEGPGRSGAPDRSGGKR